MGDDDVESPNERATRVGFNQRRVVWFGGPDMWWEDWLFFLENEHTLVSMWRGHALHPFNRTDRVCYFVCVVCFSLFMSAYIQANHPRDQGQLEYGGWLLLSSILLVVYDYGLRFIATSPCMQPGGSLHASCWLCRDCCIDCGRQGLYVCFAGSFAFLVAAVVLAVANRDVDPSQFFVTFLVMKFCSYVAEIGPLAYTFYTQREKQRPHWMDGVPGGPYPLGVTFPDAAFVRDSRIDGDAATWPGEEQRRRNPLIRGSSSSSLSRVASPTSSEDPAPEPVSRAAKADSRQKQIEMLRKARDRVRDSSRRSNPDPLDALGNRDII